MGRELYCVRVGTAPRFVACAHAWVMVLSLWSLLKATLLVVNAFAVLHPQRFLRRCACARGWQRCLS